MKTGTFQSTLVVTVMLALAATLPASAGPALKAGGSLPAKTSLKLACSATTSLEVEDWRGTVFGNNLFFLISLLSRNGIEIDIARVPRKRGIVDAVNGKYDGLCSCLSNEKLQATFHHSQPLGYISIGVVSNRGYQPRFSVKHPRIKSRQPVRWGVVSGDGLISFVKDEGIRQFTVLESQEQGYQMLDLGRIDKLIVLGSSVRKHAKQAIFRLKYQYAELARPTVHFCLAGPKGKEIIARLDGALKNYHLVAAK